MVSSALWALSLAAALATTAALAATGPATRRVWRCDKPGSIAGLRLDEEPLPAAVPRDHVVVAVDRIGLNFADVWTVLGLYKAAPKGESVVPGLEFCGRVVEVGAGSAHEVGARVFGFTRFGAFATHVTVPSDFVRALPAGWSLDEGAAFVVQGLTAWHALVELAQLRVRCADKRADGAPPPVVLVHSAAGGVGLLAVDLCQRLGATVVATVGSQGKAGFLCDTAGLAPEQVVVRPPGAKAKVLRELFTQAAKAASPDPPPTTATASGGMEAAAAAAAAARLLEPGVIDVSLDGIGGPCFQASLAALDRGGTVVHFGGSVYATRSDQPNWLHIVPRYLTRFKLDPGELVSRNLAVQGFNLIFLTDQVAKLNRELDELLALAPRRPHVGRCFDFGDAPDALRFLQSGESVGKVVLRVTPEE